MPLKNSLNCVEDLTGVRLLYFLCCLGLPYYRLRGSLGGRPLTPPLSARPRPRCGRSEATSLRTKPSAILTKACRPGERRKEPAPVRHTRVPARGAYSPRPTLADMVLGSRGSSAALSREKSRREPVGSRCVRVTPRPPIRVPVIPGVTVIAHYVVCTLYSLVYLIVPSLQVFEELQVELPDPVWSFDARKGIVRSSVGSCIRFTALSCFRMFYSEWTKRSWACGSLYDVANSITTGASAQLAPLPCLSTGDDRSHPPGGRDPAPIYLAAAAVPRRFPQRAQARASAAQQTSNLKPIHCNSEDRARRGAGRQHRGLPASAPISAD
ncbi:hypothetical protein NDU88_003775 [Pleurodeles waltl]|uniref:Uncharacterized protein n=1 Tax=Pleurodeles waltl TaxID=8319 RepID=A0AAV7LGH0_PLEWA|nr:hypothetical protein NDU88_003775 [Pleurodeles waltl]